jgi:hypothetical protein
MANTYRSAAERCISSQALPARPPDICFLCPCHSVAPVKRHILHLDSSTASKFSRHLVITIPGVVWADNSHAGAAVTAFVLQCCTVCGVSLGQEMTEVALIVRLRKLQGVTSVYIHVTLARRRFRRSMMKLPF